MPSLGDLILGGGHKRTYTPDEQAAFSAKYPSLVWRDGVPYTQAPESTIDPNDPYAYQSGADTGALVNAAQGQSGGLVEADLNDPNFLKQLARFAAITSAGEMGASFLPGANSAAGAGGDFAFTGGGSGAVGGGSAGTTAGGMGGVSFAPGAAGAGGAGPMAGVSFAPGAGAAGAGGGAATGTAALGSGSAATGIAGGSAALPASAAPVLSGPGAGAAATGWRSWLPKVMDFLPAAASVVGGIQGNKAIDKAQKQQQAATEQAMRIGGDVYAQQRADAQNLFGQPYQTLGSLMGMNIAPIGPPTGQVPTTSNPMGFQRGLVANTPPQIRPGFEPGSINTGLTPYRGPEAQTLAQLVAPAKRAASSRSGYDPRRA